MTTEAEGYLREVKSPTGLKRVLEFEVPRERVEKEIAEIIHGLKREISLPGFRKGKAPLDLVRVRFAETARKEAIEKLVPEAYQKALEKESLRPVLPAEISDMNYGDEGPLTFQIAVELFPSVEIARFDGIKVKKEKAPVEDADVDRELESLRQRLARFDKLEREAEAGDIIVADYWRLGRDEKPVRGSRVTNYPFELGSSGLVKEFTEALTGAKKGDSKTIHVTYPDDFGQEELRGQSVTFVVEVKEVGRRILPEIDEDFIKTVGVDSLDALRGKIREGLGDMREQESISRMKRDILNRIIQDSPFEVPEGLVGMALESLMKQYREDYQRSGETDIEEKLSQIRERLRPLAVNVVKEQFIIDDIAKRENIVVEDSEVDHLLQSVAGRAGIPVEEARRRAAESEEIGRWRRDILKGKVMDLLLDRADVEK